MNIKNLHIAQTGEYMFSIEESFDFMSNQNLLEYDFIVMDTNSLIDSMRGSLRSDVEKRIKNLRDFITMKNVAVPIFLSKSNNKVALAGSSYSIFGILDIKCTEEAATGKKIEVNSACIFSEIINENLNDFEYLTSFNQHEGISIGKAKSREISIGFYTKDFVFLPEIVENNIINDGPFIKELYALCRKARNDDSSINLPSWVSKFMLPGEKEDKSKLEAIFKSLAKLEKEKVKQEKELIKYSPLKQLWSLSGDKLEKAVEDVFRELEFEILDTVPGRDDLIMKWKDQIIVAEIKGLNKSAAEKNAAQLEKWVSNYHSNNDVNPKGLLIVNTYRESSLSERTEDSFPHQMLAYSEKREHCLLTTVQLCCLLLSIRAKPDTKEQEIDKLLNTVGVYKEFNNWSDYIEVDIKQ